MTMTLARTAGDVLREARDASERLLELQIAHGEVCSTCHQPVEIELCGHEVAA